MLKNITIRHRFVAISRALDLERKILFFSKNSGFSESDVRSAFLAVKTVAGGYREFGATDLLFFAGMSLLKDSRNSSQILYDVFNGFMSPFGEQYAALYRAAPFTISTLGDVDFLSYAAIKTTYAPFRSVMLFDDVKLGVIAIFKNYLPRHKESSERLQMLDRLRLDIVDWAVNIGFSDDQVSALKKGDFVNLAWRAMPLVSSDRYDRVLTYGKFLSILSFHDDKGDNLSAIGNAENALKTLEERNYILTHTFKGKFWFRNHSDPIIRAAAEVANSVAELCFSKSDLNFDWFSESMEMYLQKSSDESKDIMAGRVITDGYYLEHLRPYTSGLYACFALSAILQEIPVAQSDLVESTVFSQLLQNANLHVAIANDMISSPKEISQRAISLVLVKLLQSARDFDIIGVEKVFLTQTDLQHIAEVRPMLFQVAVETVVTTLNNYMAAYYQASRDISSELQFFDEAVVRPWILGNGDWQDQTSERYRKKLDLPVAIEDCADRLQQTGYRVIDLSK